jgi:hypothetical protein
VIPGRLGGLGGVVMAGHCGVTPLAREWRPSIAAPGGEDGQGGSVRFRRSTLGGDSRKRKWEGEGGALWEPRARTKSDEARTLIGHLSCQAWRKISSGDSPRSRRAGNSEKPGSG